MLPSPKIAASTTESPTQKAALSPRPTRTKRCADNMACSRLRSLDEQFAVNETRMKELDSHVDKITAVVELISAIADNTNLLALNAAIEAARAGEQGRGFAVVADEVRSLASRTQDSTSEIQSIIETLQKRAEQANQVMILSRENADETVSKVESENEALVAIDSYVIQINSAISLISNAAGQQAIASSEVSESVNMMSDISYRTMTDSKATTQSAQAFKAVGEQVGALLGQFKV